MIGKGDMEQPVVEETAGIFDGIVAMTVGEGSEVETFTGAKGDGETVVVTGVAFDGLSVKKTLAALHALNVLVDIGNVPTAGVAVVGMGGSTETDVGGVVPVG